MDNNSIYWIIIFLLASAFFSAAETSLFSFNKLHQKKLENSDKKCDKRVLNLLSKPRLLLITILLGNTLVNIAVSSFATVYSLNLKDNMGIKLNDSTIVMLQILITTTVILILGEIIPKLIAWAKAYHVAKIVAVPIKALEIIFYPILKLLEWISIAIASNNSGNKEEEITAEEFQTLIHSQNTMHNLEDHERKILTGLFKLPKAEIREIIVPRVQITAVEASQNLEELKEIIVESGYSRIPVYKETIDDIIGVVYAKDILLHNEVDSIFELIRPAWFVTENMKIQTLLNQFKAKKTQIAIVVDEYGGTSGIITLEDIMEELVGEIHDEYDVDEIPLFERIDDKTFIINGMYGIRELNNELGIDIDPEIYDNVADFLLEHFNKVPKVNEEMTYRNEIRFIITDSNRKRINQIKVIKLNSDPSDEDGQE
jgi:CBS domain containing-hemolysin-like protein